MLESCATLLPPQLDVTQTQDRRRAPSQTLMPTPLDPQPQPGPAWLGSFAGIQAPGDQLPILGLQSPPADF